MAIQFTWDQSYSVGNSEIDQQHRRMLELASSIPEKLDEPSIRQLLMKIHEHAQEHFTDEENMMKEIGYPRLAEHRELHETLITQLDGLRAQSFHSEKSVRRFKRFVYDWVIDHIMNEDMDYFRFSERVLS